MLHLLLHFTRSKEKEALGGRQACLKHTVIPGIAGIRSSVLLSFGQAVTHHDNLYIGQVITNQVTAGKSGMEPGPFPLLLTQDHTP